VLPAIIADRARLRVVIIALLAAMPIGHPEPSIAAEPSAFPSRPVRFILGYPPGGASDAVARVLAQPLTARIGQQILIDNRPGAGGNIAAELAARAAADGHTWFLGNNAILATNQALYERLPYDAVKDFAAVALVGTQPSVLVTHPSLPVRSVRDLIVLAKARPGELNYASTGSGTAGHLTGELFKTLAGVKYQHIPYRGGGPAVIDLISGQVQFMFATSASVMGHVKNKRLNVLAVTSLQRSSALPDVPTVAEAGLPGFEAITWHGVVVPAATPSGAVERINTDLNAVLAQNDVR